MCHLYKFRRATTMMRVDITSGYLLLALACVLFCLIYLTIVG